MGRLIALGGGGYNLANIANAWTEVVKSLIAKPLAF
jgi:acetoin utilization deacetylase AcuC-like enzyme